MIEIIGPALNQWDVGRSVKITNIEADYCHFANYGDLKAVIMEITDDTAKIPDFLLQTGKQLCVYAVKDGITIENKIFSVTKRERPENYVYEDDQRNYIYELIANAEIAIKDARKAAEDVKKYIDRLVSAPTARLANVKLLASAWAGADSLYSQVATVEGVTPYSKVDLLPSVEQLAIFHNKDIAFVTENEGGVVTVFAIGDKPTNDYTIQVAITEVTV